MMGLDSSGLMLRTARAKAPGLRLVGADAANLPFPNRTFDGAICTLAIHHYDDLEASFRKFPQSGGLASPRHPCQEDPPHDDEASGRPVKGQHAIAEHWRRSPTAAAR